MARRKAKTKPTQTASDRRSKRAFRLTANVTTSSTQTVREVRSGIHV